jgi:hypothetical protein
MLDGYDLLPMTTPHVYSGALGLNVGWETDYPDRISVVFAQSLQKNSRILARIGHDSLLRNPL